MLNPQKIMKPRVPTLTTEALMEAAAVVEKKTLLAGKLSGFAKQPSNIKAGFPVKYNHPHRKLLIEAGGTNTRVTLEILKDGVKSRHLIFSVNSKELDTGNESNPFMRYLENIFDRVEKGIQSLPGKELPIEALCLIWSNGADSVECDIQGVTGINQIVNRSVGYNKGEFFAAPEALPNGFDLGNAFIGMAKHKKFTPRVLVIANDTTVLPLLPAPEGVHSFDSGVVLSTGGNGTGKFIGKSGKAEFFNLECGNLMLHESPGLTSLISPDELDYFAGVMKMGKFASFKIPVEYLAAGQHYHQLFDIQLKEMTRTSPSASYLGQLNLAKDFSVGSNKIVDQLTEGNMNGLVDALARTNPMAAQIIREQESVKKEIRELAISLCQRAAQAGALITWASIANQAKDGCEINVALDSAMASFSKIYFDTLCESVRTIAGDRAKVNIHLMKWERDVNGNNVPNPTTGIATLADTLLASL